MAKLMIYSVYDSKVKFFDRPLFLRNRGEALRAWEQAANDEKTTISAHPSDFAIMEIGEFDDQTGKIISLAVPESLGLAVQFKRVAPTAKVEQWQIDEQERFSEFERQKTQ